MNDYLNTLVSLVNDIYFKVNIVVPLGLLWRIVSEVTAFAVVVEAWDLLCLEISEIAILWLVPDKIEGFNVFACWIVRNTLHEFVQLTKHTEKSLSVDLFFDYYDRSVWLDVSAISDSKINPQLTVAC